MVHSAGVYSHLRARLGLPALEARRLGLKHAEAAVGARPVARADLLLLELPHLYIDSPPTRANSPLQPTSGAGKAVVVAGGLESSLVNSWVGTTNLSGPVKHAQSRIIPPVKHVALHSLLFTRYSLNNGNHAPTPAPRAGGRSPGGTACVRSSLSSRCLARSWRWPLAPMTPAPPPAVKNPPRRRSGRGVELDTATVKRVRHVQTAGVTNVVNTQDSQEQAPYATY
eukprot:1175648-Prorocentrum_minimum.AAC.2